jgi:DNA-binding transcriptional MerR regulator
MRISEIAQRSGLSASAIRYYEKSGVLPAPRRESGARDFTENDLDTLSWIAQGRNADLMLRDIESTLPHNDSKRERGAMLVRRLLVLESKQRELAATLDTVENLRTRTRRELDELLRGCGLGLSVDVD